MHPFIRNDDLVTIAPMHGISPRPGDVVAFVSPESGKLTIHRIVKRIGENYLTKGDNLYYADGFAHRSRILGYVTNVERKGRSVIFGLGIERFLIAILTRKGSMYKLLLPFWNFVRPFVKRH